MTYQQWMVEVPYLSNAGREALVKAGITNAATCNVKNPLRLFNSRLDDYAASLNHVPSLSETQVLRNAIKLAVDHLTRVPKGNCFRSLMRIHGMNRVAAEVLWANNITNLIALRNLVHISYLVRPVEKTWEVFDRVCKEVDITPDEADMIWTAIFLAVAKYPDPQPKVAGSYAVHLPRPSKKRRCFGSHPNWLGVTS